MDVTYYGDAADAAGTEREQLDTSDTTAEHLVSLLSARHEGLSGVLKSCSLLVDGTAVTDPQTRVYARSRAVGHEPLP